MRYPAKYPNGVVIYKTKRGYRVEYKDEAGKRKAALRVREEDALEEAARRSLGEEPRRDGITLQQVAEEWIRVETQSRGWGRRHVDNQRDALERWVVPYLDGPVDRITRPRIAAVAATVRDEVKSAGYQKQILGTLKRLWDYAVMMGYVPQDRAGWAELVVKGRRSQGHARDYVDPSERPDTRSVTHLLSVAMGTPLEAPIVLAAFCGLRWGEMAALEPEDLDFEQGLIHVDRQGQWQDGLWIVKLPKGEKTRTTIIPERVVVILKDLAEEAGDRLLCVAPDGQPWKPNRFHEALQKVKAEADGWDARWSYHSLRHHFATWLLGKGMAVEDVAALMGHASPDITWRAYVGVTAGVHERARELTRSL